MIFLIEKIYVFLSTDYSNLGDHALTLSQLQLLNNKKNLLIMILLSIQLMILLKL